MAGSLPAGRLPEEWEALLSEEPPFRSRQLFQALQQQGKRRWEEITVLPERIRSLLAQESLISSVVVREIPGGEGTEKLIIQLSDGPQIETVLLRDKKGRQTACLSSQAGCAMGCRFCRTGQGGLKRSLRTGEIIEQLWHMEDRYGPMANIVFMGMGEPFHNYDAWMKAVEILSHPQGRGMSARRMTVSTCGLPEGIRRLGKEGSGVRLALSLTSANPALREELMPITKRYPLGELKKALTDYQAAGGKRVTLEMVLIKDLNDTTAEADALARFTQNLSVMVNLIPWNPVEGLPYREPSAEAVQTFMKALEVRGIKATRRRRRASGASGACGQLG